MKKHLFLKKKLSFKNQPRFEDIKKLVDIAEHFGYLLSDSDAEELWKDYSSRYNREWVDIYSSIETVWSIIRERTFEEGAHNDQSEFKFQ